MGNLTQYFGIRLQDDFDEAVFNPGGAGTYTLNLNNRGAAATRLTDGGIIFDLVSEGFTSENQVITEQTISSRAPRQIAAGQFKTSGSIEAIAQTELLAWFAYLVSGYSSYNAGAGADENVILPADMVPFFDAEFGMGENYLAKQIYSAVAGTLTIDCTAGQYPKLTLDCPGARASTTVPWATSLGGSDDFVAGNIAGGDVLVTHRSKAYIREQGGIGQIDIPASSVKITINANPDVDPDKIGDRLLYFYKNIIASTTTPPYQLGAGPSADYCPTVGRSAEIELTLRWGQTDDLIEFFFGANGYAVPSTDNLDPLEFYLNLFGQSSSGVGASLKSALIYFPKCTVKTGVPTMSGRDAIEQTVTLVPIIDEDNDMETLINRTEITDGAILPATIAAGHVLTDYRGQYSITIWDGDADYNVGEYNVDRI